MVLSDGAHGDDLLQQRTQGIITEGRNMCSRIRGSHASQAAPGSCRTRIASAVSHHNTVEHAPGRLTEPGSQHITPSAPGVPGGCHMLPMLLMPGVRAAALHDLSQISPPRSTSPLCAALIIELGAWIQGLPQGQLLYSLSVVHVYSPLNMGNIRGCGHGRSGRLWCPWAVPWSVLERQHDT